MQRSIHYGAWVDFFRSFYAPLAGGTADPTKAGNGPCLTYVEATCPWGPTGDVNLAKPWWVAAAVWNTIIHRARWIVYFGQNNTQGQLPTPGGPWFGTWGTQIQSPNTISMFDQCKVLHTLIRTLAPVINSPFVVASPTQPATISSANGAGFTLPYLPDLYPTGTLSKPYYNKDLRSLFEIMVHQYTYTTETPVIYGTTLPTNFLVQNGYWLWCIYRGWMDDTSLGTVTVTLNTSILVTGSVSRIYADGVFAPLTIGATTTFTTGDTNWISVGDRITIVGSVGVTNLNGIHTVSAKTATTVSFTGVTTSGSLTKNGVVICEHTIPVSGGVFTDTYPYGSSVGIYRVN
jgi:hypothetical protein